MSEGPTIFYLEMLDRSVLQPSAAVAGFELKEVAPADASLNRRYYEQVGADWKWTDRLPWSDVDWQTHVEREELSTFLAIHHGEDVGYVELEQQPEGNVQISYFGLLPHAYGKGLGGAMLTGILETAWDLPGTQRVWVHTCTDDHDAALANYQKRGFRLYSRISGEAMGDGG